MQNPLASEEAAFRFVLGAIVYFALIVVAAWIATWLGVIVFVAMSALAFVVLRRGTASAPPVVSTERAAVDDTRRILVVTDNLPVGPRLREAILRRAEPVTEDVLLIWAVATSVAGGGGGDAAGVSMPEDLETAVCELRSAGINARGSLSVGDPLGAVEDALRGFDADEVVISTASSAEGVAGAARALFEGPVTAIVEDKAR
jgi:hypothetical protein